MVSSIRGWGEADSTYYTGRENLEQFTTTETCAWASINNSYSLLAPNSLLQTGCLLACLIPIVPLGAWVGWHPLPDVRGRVPMALAHITQNGPEPSHYSPSSSTFITVFKFFLHTVNLFATFSTVLKSARTLHFVVPGLNLLIQNYFVRPYLYWFFQKLNAP